jgi:ketosteroid isomerase-like protein
MSERERNIALTRDAFEAFQRGDVEAVNSFIDPEIRIRISDDLANSGTWSGVEGFWESIGSWLDAWDNFEIEVLSIDAPDDAHVIVEAHQTATGRASGVPVELTTYFAYELIDGKATVYELHATREAALAAIGQTAK